MIDVVQTIRFNFQMRTSWYLIELGRQDRQFEERRGANHAQRPLRLAGAFGGAEQLDIEARKLKQQLDGRQDNSCDDSRQEIERDNDDHGGQENERFAAMKVRELNEALDVNQFES